MKRLTFLAVGLVLLGVGLLFAQPGLDPWWRPLNPQGQSRGVTYGLTVPTDPGNGEVAVDMDGAWDSGPVFQIWDNDNIEWDMFLSFLGAAADNDPPLTVVEIAPMLSIMDGAGDIQRVLHLNIDNVDHTAGAVYGVHLDLDAADVQAIETGLVVDGAWNIQIGFLGDAAARIVAETVGTNNILQLDAVGIGRTARLAIAGTQLTANLTWFDFRTTTGTPLDMDGGDTIRALHVNVGDGAHTGTDNKLIAVELNTLTADINADEIGIVIEEGWETGVQSAGRILVRETFEQPFIVLEEDYTAKAMGDNAINTVQGSPSGIIDYYEEGAKGTSSWIIADGDLDISADDGAQDNEGFELMLGDDDDATSGWLVAQTDTLCFTVNATTALIAGTDQFLIGWRTSEAFQDLGAVADYTTFAYVGQTNIDGSVFMFVDDGDSANDDSGVNIANASTNTYKVCMEADGGAAAYLNGTEITNTNTTGQLIGAGTNMVPFISYLCVAGTDAAILVHYWEITGT